jgi:hypothetical protein
MFRRPDSVRFRLLVVPHRLGLIDIANPCLRRVLDLSTHLRSRTAELFLNPMAFA